MAENERQVRQTLNLLYQISEAGEKGFATASANIHNQGIKILFRSYAQQRAKAKAELLEELRKLGQQDTPRPSLSGILHRGSFAILNGMTIGPENQERAILKEALRGESVAIRYYERALEKENPAPIRDLIQRQLDQIREVSRTVNLLRGGSGKRLLVRLFERAKDAEQAARLVATNGINTQAIEQTALDRFELYPGKGASTLETVTAGAFWGALLGALIGVLAGIGIVQTTHPGAMGTVVGLSTLGLVILAMTAVISLLLAILALFLGAGTAELDRYEYQESLGERKVLLKARVDDEQAGKVSRILDRALGAPGATAVGETG